MLRDMSENHEKSSSEPPIGSSSSEDSERDHLDGEALRLPSLVAGSGSLDRLVETARDYARAARKSSASTFTRTTHRIPAVGSRSWMAAPY
jgi:hypothetical protein